MYQNLLVPVDFTDANLQALEAAADLAQRDGARIGLLHVIQTIPGLPLEGEREFYRSLEQSARRRMAEFGALLDRKAVGWRSEIRLGSRLVEILHAIAEKEIDLVVLSSHRVDLSEPGRGLGTLSYQVAVLAPCPVLLVK